MLPVFRSNCSPGPVYFIDPMVTRHGRDGTPSYSMLARQREPSRYFIPISSPTSVWSVV